MVELEKRTPRPGENTEEFLHREIGRRFRGGYGHGLNVIQVRENENAEGMATKCIKVTRGMLRLVQPSVHLVLSVAKVPLIYRLAMW